MKQITLTLLLVISCSLFAGAQTAGYKFIEASELNIIGKIHPDTPNPYHRVDTVKFKGFTKSENNQVRCASGLAVVFKTNSTAITVKTEYGPAYTAVNTMPISYRGYDLYIKKDGEWLWAAAGATKTEKSNDNLVLIRNMDNTEKECLLYLPIYNELLSVQIGVDKDAEVSAIESPFRHRVGIFGSSFTHGISTSRAGMSYPAQFTRHTGIQLLSLGCSGNSKLQPYFADVLCAADVDALIFDSFSNPSAEQIKERLFPFIERIQEAHPDIPLIFQRTIYRERRNFDLATEKSEAGKQAMSDSLMAIAVKKYDNVYYIRTNATDELHETSVDGTHPGDYGYTLWARSIEKPVLRILKKYGVK
ncbi:MAG: SGNH/GDSL hydrolase N-terminal domain-containing protein [Candidatus Cryptobacteroides sp.]